jgi:hypothetical protein
MIYAISFDMLNSYLYLEKTVAARSRRVHLQATVAAWRASLDVTGWRSAAVFDSHFDKMSWFGCPHFVQKAIPQFVVLRAGF